MPRVASCPEDFVVDEIPLYAPSGEGEHTFVQVEKRLRNTEQVASELARLAGVRPREVGYAGRKDRVAVTRQWFSVPGLAPERARGARGEGWQALQAASHRHRLRVGQLRGNRFELVVRELAPDDPARVEARLARASSVGVPNRFGHQRFGREADNAERGARILCGEAPVGERRRARFLLSALQAEAFNRVLADRPGPLDRVEAGDLAMLHASGGCFRVEDVARECERAARFEISATGPIFGTRMLEPQGEPGRREARQLRALGVPEPAALRPPRGLRLRGARRALLPAARRRGAAPELHAAVGQLRHRAPGGALRSGAPALRVNPRARCSTLPPARKEDRQRCRSPTT